MLTRIAWRGLTLAIAYAAGWTIAYTIVMGSDFRYFVDYLRLAWFSPGELPATINVIAMGLALSLFAAIEVARAVRRRAKRAHRLPAQDRRE